MQKIHSATILAVIMVVLVIGVASLLMVYQRVPNHGNLKAIGVEVYWDSDCTNNVTAIDWGFLEPEATVNLTVYIKNDGNVPVVLSMTTENWDPTYASEHVGLNWNRESYVLDPGSVPAVLTLTVSPDTGSVSSFSFDLLIVGTEQA